MITQSITLQSEAEYREHEQHVGAELLRQVVDDLRANGWERDDFDRFIRELMDLAE